MVAVAIFVVVFAWNDFLFAFIFTATAREDGAARAGGDDRRDRRRRLGRAVRGDDAAPAARAVIRPAAAMAGGRAHRRVDQGMIERDPATALPRLRLARLPTPLEPAPRLAEALGLGALWIKREDLARVALGGNKLRQIQFILAAAMQAGAETIVHDGRNSESVSAAPSRGHARDGRGAIPSARRGRRSAAPAAGSAFRRRDRLDRGD